MKNLKYILIIATFIIFSCDKDNKPEEPELNIPPELVGKWKTVQVWETDGGYPFWSNYDSGCEWDIWFNRIGEYFSCSHSNNIKCYPIFGNFNITENDIIINRAKNPCINELDLKSIWTIEKLTNDTLLYELHFWEGAKTLLVKVNDQDVSDSCSCQ